jgi:hypothetical protein
MRLILAALLMILACLAPPAAAKGSSHSPATATHSTASHSGSHSSLGWPSGGSHASHSKAAPGVHRDAHGKIARSEKAKDDFKRQHPCPSTGTTHGSCPGYVIDHITPLRRGGADAPYNMQWQTGAAAKAKDKWE